MPAGPTESCSDVPGEDFALRVFDDGLPAELVRRARDALHPAASYWHDHRYHSEDVAFYSHAHFPGDETHVIDQLIEAMRPLLAEVDPKVGSSLKVAEWWVHQRQPDQWHGHPLHYDTNEQLLRDSQGRCVEHPAISSVVYLCDDSPRFGATVVTSQEYGDAAKPGFRGEAALVRPKLGRVLFFKGSYLHGALPGRPWLEDGDPQRRLNVMVGWWTTPIATQPAADPPAPLMRSGVGTWIRDLGKARLDGVAGGARAVEEEVRGASPIWADCGHGEAGEGEGDSALPPFGRFFLRRDLVGQAYSVPYPVRVAPDGVSFAGRIAWRLVAKGPNRRGWQVSGLRIFSDLSCREEVSGLVTASGFADGHEPELAVGSNDTSTFWEASCTQCTDQGTLGVSLTTETILPRCFQLYQPDDAWAASSISIQVLEETDEGETWLEAGVNAS
ncbi:unnamed protein product [Symbiodinium natans]|uniref:Uncharacterized protein n=1 Tax=Symbiodinium natans TaxID=878477 RepID=A0A812S6W9_9DINO|nr:unnamed protein product [Symbiodinium natans]